MYKHLARLENGTFANTGSVSSILGFLLQSVCLESTELDELILLS